MTTLTLVPKKITHGDELVILPKKEYDNLRRRLDETRDALIKIREGEKEYKAGKIRPMRSLSQLDKR
ncbi:MAG: hypothetical protein CVU77_08825 [Elusimicrobia bacterium HGW-Elusimicrobia-1]|jgi:hypothetical protein|nr:MAG: hypothetical protein CVU77_08825 [Elusimicrobia bacterium HGW-Elusimicrobia-1]